VYNRRKLLIALGAGALAAPLTAFSQQSDKVWRVGFLAFNRRPDSIESHVLYGAFIRGMRDLGYVEGKNLTLEWRFADNNPARLAGFAEEFVRMKVDAIVAASTVPTRAAQKATSTIPIVMLTSYDPVGDGFVKTLARPGGNITGRTNISVELGPKLLEMLRVMLPKLARVVLLLNPDNSSLATALKSIQDAARKSLVTIVPLEARTPKDIEQAFTQMTRQKVGALIVIRDALFNQQVSQIAELSVKHRLPAIASISDFAEAGGLMSYGESRSESPRRAAVYLDKIFKCAKPADLPVEQPTIFELVINGKTAKTLGLKIPNSVLVQAIKVIE
jgi:putative ABC transport system substrate-binding protein